MNHFKFIFTLLFLIFNNLLNFFRLFIRLLFININILFFNYVFIFFWLSVGLLNLLLGRRFWLFFLIGIILFWDNFFLLFINNLWLILLN